MNMEEKAENENLRVNTLFSLVTRDCALRSMVLSPKSTIKPPRTVGLT